MAASLACTGALIAILYRFQNLPSNSWPFAIGMNAAIALFVTAARGTLLVGVYACLGEAKWIYSKKQPGKLHDLAVLDQATHGFVGAIKALKVSSGLTRTGSTILLLAAGSHFLSQQVLYYELSAIGTNDSSAFFVYAQSYDSGSKRNTATLSPLSFDENTIDSTIQGAICRGLYESSWSSTSHCSSNWTRNDNHYIVLGFDSSYFNITVATLLTTRCNTTTDQFDCAMKTPGGVILMTHFVQSDWQSVAIVSTSSLQNNYTASYFHSPNFLQAASWNATSNASTYAAGDEIFGENVVERTLSLVAWNYSNINSFSNNFTIGKKERISLDFGFSSIDGFGITFNQTGIPSLYISNSDLGAVISFFNFTISGELFEGESQPPNNPGCTSAFLHQNPSDIFNRVALNMNDQIQGGRMQKLALGVTEIPVQLIRIKWFWLLLPLGAQIAGAILLVVTVFKSREYRKIAVREASPVSATEWSY